MNVKERLIQFTRMLISKRGVYTSTILSLMSLLILVIFVKIIFEYEYIAYIMKNTVIHICIHIYRHIYIHTESHFIMTTWFARHSVNFRPQIYKYLTWHWLNKILIFILRYCTKYSPIRLFRSNDECFIGSMTYDFGG